MKHNRWIRKMASALKVVDITNLCKADSVIDKKVADEIYSALKIVGACYISGHGIPAKFVSILVICKSYRK